MDVGKLLNHVNIVSSDCFLFVQFFSIFSCLTGLKLG